MRVRKPFQRIGVEQAGELIRQRGPLVIDARDSGSFARAHIAGAQHLAFDDLPRVFASAQRARPILVYCYHGSASQTFAQAFSDFGFEAYSLDGGFDEWSART